MMQTPPKALLKLLLVLDRLGEGRGEREREKNSEEEKGRGWKGRGRRGGEVGGVER